MMMNFTRFVVRINCMGLGIQRFFFCEIANVRIMKRMWCLVGANGMEWVKMKESFRDKREVLEKK